MSEDNPKRNFDRLAEELAAGDHLKRSRFSRLWKSLKELKSEIRDVSKEQRELLAANKRFSDEARARSLETQKRNDEFYENMLGELREQNAELQAIVAATKRVRGHSKAAPWIPEGSPDLSPEVEDPGLA